MLGLYGLQIRNSYTIGCPPVRGNNPQIILRTDGQTWQSKSEKKMHIFGFVGIFSTFVRPLLHNF